MLEKITGSCYKSMIDYGINNLNRYCSVVNELNVFPVPDGDTGTNMVMTMKNGLHSVKDEEDSIGVVAERFANATVFGARGNSGVIISQFFKGLALVLKDKREADCTTFIKALHNGCLHAYSAVANPTEGTVLTVLKDATQAVMNEIGKLATINDLISKFIYAAKISLENTPNLLPILNKAGVVDSGGAGVVYFFEGVQKYLNGEKVEDFNVNLDDEQENYVDYSAFNKNSVFEFGYCTELLIQVTVDNFDYSGFLNELECKGDSLVASFDDYKVKVHIHTKTPEKILEYCHKIGEFLSLKIENMSVQHTQLQQKILCSDNCGESEIAVVAVAPNPSLQGMFAEMGADVVILSKEAPSSGDFLEAFKFLDNHKILVFPNSSNSIMSAVQAVGLCDNDNVTVINCKSIAECYSSLAIIDFGDNLENVIKDINATIENIYSVSLTRAVKDVVFGDVKVFKDDYFALAGEEIVAVSHDICDAVMKTVENVSKNKECSVLNLFYGKNITDHILGLITQAIDSGSYDFDVVTISTDNDIIDITLSFE